ncbi:MAG TPA: peptide chain release factor N(5)-glutamine methyltransferase [Gaiellaceae bacterium]|nr:peptide chain release factor N(5)-glutamine methyltransferase [Gaiellaceae bacterium]
MSPGGVVGRTEPPRNDVGEVLRLSAEHLARKGVESPRLDAELLLGKALGLSRLDLYLHHDRPLTPPERDSVRELVRRRAGREPLAYVLGAWGFRGLTLRCDPRALVPRPETEIVVERCLELLEGLETPHVLDVGTGTGAIALALAREHPGARVTGLDRSPAALALARENAAATGIEVELVEGDALEGLPPGPWELVVSNPPYVLEGEELPPELSFEPRQALVASGQTEAIARGARAVLRGPLVLEVHGEHAGEAAERLRSLGYADVRIGRDLAGRERVVEGRWEQ